MPRLSLLWRAGLRHYLQHRWQGLLALSGIVLGVALVLAVDLATDAASSGLRQSARWLDGPATHRLDNPAGPLSETLFTELFTQSGAPPMAPRIEGRVRIAGRDGRFRLLGVDPLAEARLGRPLLSGEAGNFRLLDWLTRPDALALGQATAGRLGLKPGDRLRVGYRGREHSLRLLAVLPGLPPADDLLLVDIASAQALLGRRGQLDHIALAMDDATAARLADRLPPGLRLRPVGESAAGLARLSAAFELNLTAMSLLALLVGGFLIFNAIQFALLQRRRLFGRLRAVGVTGAELARLILFEAFALGLIGGLIGLLLGRWLGGELATLVGATVSELYYPTSASASTDPGALARALLLGLGASLVAAALPARQAAGLPPLSTLSRELLERQTRRAVPRLAGAGLALLLLGLGLGVLLPLGLIAAFVGLFALILGCALLTPLALELAQRLLDRLPLAGVARMAVRDLQRHLSRLAIAAAALMVALAAGSGVTLMVDSMRGAVDHWLAESLSADLYVAAEGFADGESLPNGLDGRLARLASVGSISRYRERRIELAGRPVRLIGAELQPRSRAGFDLLGGDATRVWSAFDGGGLLLSEPLARRLGVASGDVVELPTADGPHRFAVAGVFRDFASEHGRIFLPLERFREHWRDRRLNTLALFAADGAASMRAEVARVTANQPVVLTPPEAIRAASLAVFQRTFRITEVLRLLLLGVAFVGAFSALMALQLERRKEYAVLRALGLTPRQVGGLMLLGSALLGLLAALLSLPVGALIGWLLTASVQLRAFGWSMPFEPGIGPLLTTLLLGLVAALLAALWPAWRALRTDPAPQLRED